MFISKKQLMELENKVKDLEKELEDCKKMQASNMQDIWLLRSYWESLDVRLKTLRPEDRTVNTAEKESISKRGRGTRLPKDFCETFYPYLVKCMNGEMTITEVKKELDIANDTFYRYKKKLLPRYEESLKRESAENTH